MSICEKIQINKEYLVSLQTFGSSGNGTQFYGFSRQKSLIACCRYCKIIIIKDYLYLGEILGILGIFEIIGIFGRRNMIF
jgi:hypothetical protein